MGTATPKSYYHWLLQCDKDSNEINLKYYNRRDFNGIVIDTVFDLGVCLTEVYHDKEDLQNRLQSVPIKMVQLIDENAPIFSIVYTIVSGVNSSPVSPPSTYIFILPGVKYVYETDIVSATLVATVN